jgi:hypothetical protein
MPTRLLSAIPLRVVPALVGRPLASPLRRAAALAVDLAVVAVPSVAVAVAAALAGLAVSEPQALGALRTLFLHGRSVGPAERHAAMRDLAPMLVRLEAEGLPPAVRDAVSTGNLDRAADELDNRTIVFALSPPEYGQPPLAERSVRVQVAQLIPETVRGVALYGVAALYFGVLTRGRKQATLGKRVAGIRVVRLDGERLTLLESLERFVGYLHIPGSLGLSLLYLWHDPNRRLPHDRIANTAVVRVARSGS